MENLVWGYYWHWYNQTLREQTGLDYQKWHRIEPTKLIIAYQTYLSIKRKRQLKSNNKKIK